MNFAKNKLLSVFRKKSAARGEPTSAPRSLPSNRALNRHAEEKKPAPPTILPKPIAQWIKSSPDGPVDSVLAGVAIALIGFGVVMVYSSSTVEAATKYHDAQFFLKRQSVYAALALFAMWVMSRIDYRRLKPFTYPILVGVIGLLVATIVGFGHRAGNANRWLSIGPIHIQPAELAKLGIVFWLAYSLSKKAEKIKSFAVGFLPHLFVAGILMLLCLKQPDFGSAVVLLFLTFTMMFVAGAKVPYIAAFTALLGLGAVFAVTTSNYRYARYVSWIDMDAHRDGSAYQPFQSVMSFGSGGTWGLGLGKGLQVLYLPEAHTDFISAIIGEELGFVGILGLVAAYLVVVSRSVKVALRAADDYGSYLAFGIATLFGVQALTNLCVAMAILPTKGLTLPLISYGGSSLMVNAAAVGVLLSISRPRRALEPEPQKPVEKIDLPSASGVVIASADEGAAGW